MTHEHEAKTEAEPAVGPALTLLFDGLFFICFSGSQDPTAQCEIGLLSTAPEHRVGIHVKQAVAAANGGVDQNEWSVSLSPTQVRNIEQIELDIPRLGPEPSVRRKGHEDQIIRSRPKEKSDYFQWIIDLENEEMHGQLLQMTERVLRPKLVVKTGEFYTAQVSDQLYDRIQGSSRKPFGAVAIVTGVRIDSLPAGQAFLKAAGMTVPLVKNSNTSCIVHFTNRRAEHEHGGQPTFHSDFPYYYHVFGGVHPSERFDFESASEGLPPTICYSSGGSRTTSIT